MRNIIILVFFTFLFTSCKKNKSIQQIPVINSINFTHNVDRNNLVLGPDTSCCSEGSILPYTNADGQKYNVQRLRYLISNINLHTDNETYKIKDIHYIDFDSISTHTIEVRGIESLNYTGISFTMGLDNDLNLTNVSLFGGNQAYENESWHEKMIWPKNPVNSQPGGYHYMKLEGDLDTLGVVGYATHTGPTFGTDYSFYKYFDLAIRSTARQTSFSININMNINNWYTNPNNFTLNSNGVMEDSTKQKYLMENGEADVFSIFID